MPAGPQDQASTGSSAAAAARHGGPVGQQRRPGRLRAYLQTEVTEGIAGGYAFAPIRHGGMERDSLGVYVVTQGTWTPYA